MAAPAWCAAVPGLIDINIVVVVIVVIVVVVVVVIGGFVIVVVVVVVVVVVAVVWSRRRCRRHPRGYLRLLLTINVSAGVPSV
jgi:hypothetical protein